MFHSEIDITKLTTNDKFNFIMHDICDLAERLPKDNEISDALVILGALPRTLYFKVMKAVELYALGYSDKIIITGGRGFARSNLQFRKAEFISSLEEIFCETENTLSGLELYNLSEAEIAFKMIKELKEVKDILPEGVNLDDVLLETESGTTMENVTNTKKLLDKNGIETNRLILVTSSYHMKRSILTFEKQLPSIEFISGPTTLDLAFRGVSKFEDMARVDFYINQFHCETDAIINYTRKGDLLDKEVDIKLEGTYELEA